MADDLTCERCGRRFSVPISMQGRYPGWKPKVCMRCRSREADRRAARRESTPTEADEEDDCPGDGESGTITIYADGSCQGNPGPGGWAVVVVRDGTAVEEHKGYEPATTNNRMELTAIIEALKAAPPDSPATIYSDSKLAVQTLNTWAAGWEKRGWRRRDGEVKNLDLVQEAWRLLKDRPAVRIKWIEGHAGHRWNERADRLATAYQRKGGTD